MSLPPVVPQARSACFDDLPNELVDLIVEFTSVEPRVLMHLCSRFRRAVFRAKFWRHFEFEFMDIFGYGMSLVRRGVIYRYLLAQDDLVQNLQSKTECLIDGPELFLCPRLKLCAKFSHHPAQIAAPRPAR